MAATNITYNGIVITDVLTDGVDQETVFDQTNTDPLYVKVTIRCTGLVHASTLPSIIGIGTGGGNLAAGWRLVAKQLQQPRRNFKMQVGNSLMYDVRPSATRPGITPTPSFDIDVNHGPRADCRIAEIISAQTMRVQFTIVTHTPWCDTQGTEGGAISFRYWIADDIDCTNWTVDRVYHGRLVVSSRDYNVFTVMRNNFKFPPLQPGFQRRKISLTQSSNGLELEFTVRDKELWAQAPGPATEWDGYHAVTSPQPGLPMQESEIYLTLEGPRQTDKRALIKLAFKIMQAKLHYDDMIKNEQAFLVNLSIRESLKNNSVEASARIKQTGTDDNTALWNIASDSLGLPLDKLPTPLEDYDQYKAVLGKTTNQSLKGLFVAFLSDPCHVNGWPQQGDTNQSPVDTQAGDQIVLVEDDEETLDNTQTSYSDEHRASAYNMYKMSSDIDSDTGLVALPVSFRKKANDPTVSIVSLHSGYAFRNVRLEAERLQSWPTVPKPESFTWGTLGHTVLKSKVYPSSPQLDAQGIKTMYHIVYELAFSLSRIPDYSKSEFPAALLPYRVPGNDQVYAVPATAFADANGFLYGQQQNT